MQVMQDWLNKGLSLIFLFEKNLNKIGLHHDQYGRQAYFYNGNTYF